MWIAGDLFSISRVLSGNARIQNIGDTEILASQVSVIGGTLQ